MKLRPIVSFNAINSVMKMGLKHGSQWDCNREVCSLCAPFREREIDEYLALSEEERSRLDYPIIGLSSLTNETSADSETSVYQ